MTKQAWLDRLEESLVASFYHAQNEDEVAAGFEETLAFGTAGIRSVMGLGPGRLNAFTVRKVALGLARYLRASKTAPKVVIHYDTRCLSDAFAREMAAVLYGEGVTAITAERYRTTPELSFAVRHLKADAGIMITASHNPSQYNGIKVYGADGGQLLPEASETLSTYINAIDDVLAIAAPEFNQGLREGGIQYLAKETTEAYKAAVRDFVGPIGEQPIKSVFTSLHGTSLPIVSELLDELGYTNYVIEETQSEPNGTFPTVAVANPEDEAVFARGLALAEKTDAQLIIATDPDADRLGFIERYEDGTTRYFNGNEMGLLFMYLRAKTMTAPTSPYIVKSVVTSALSDHVARGLGLDVVNVLTGFKFISEVLNERAYQSRSLVLAYEESHGYLAAPISYDKDAVQIVPLLIKLKAALHAKGQTFQTVLDTLYAEYGHYKDCTISPTFSGKQGQAAMTALMSSFRTAEHHTLCGFKLVAKEDYLSGQRYDVAQQQSTALTLPKTNLIRFIFEEGFIALRPSGTEPKMKVYFSLKCDDLEAVIARFQEDYLDRT